MNLSIFSYHFHELSVETMEQFLLNRDWECRRCLKVHYIVSLIIFIKFLVTFVPSYSSLSYFFKASVLSSDLSNMRFAIIDHGFCENISRLAVDVIFSVPFLQIPEKSVACFMSFNGKLLFSSVLISISQFMKWFLLTTCFFLILSQAQDLHLQFSKMTKERV